MKRFIITLLAFLLFSSAGIAGERINLAFNIDNNYVTYFLLTANSIFQHNDSNSQYYIYIVESDLTEENKIKIRKFIEKNNQNLEFINISREKLNIGKPLYPDHVPVTNIAFARIFLPELLPNLNKVLYLDSDTLILSDIKDLYNTNISGYAMGMCLDFQSNYFLHEGIFRKLIPQSKYYNDGIILMNLNFIRKYNLMNKMIDYAIKHPDLKYADQDVINYSMKGYIKTLDQKWNNQFYDGIILTDTSEGGIIHYISSLKPWMTLPKKSCPERYMYFQNWFSSEFRFDYIKDFFKIFKNPYISFFQHAIDYIKLQTGYVDTNKETIYVAFTIDDNYWLYTLLTINSILKNNKSYSPYHFYLIENNLTDKNKQKMLKYVTNRHQKIEFINIDTTIVDGGENLYQKTKQHKYISRIAMARIFLPNLLPKDLSKVLYLDSDLLITKDLKELFDTDIKKYPVAMAGDLTENIDLIKKTNERYYNDGVMLINLDYWRKYKITEKMVNYMKIKQYLPKMDQDLINIILKNKIKELEPIWNNQYGYKVAFGSNGIIHYIGPKKPWLYLATYYTDEGFQYRRLYHRYWVDSPFSMYIIPRKIKQSWDLYIFFGQKCFVEMTLWDFRGIK